MMYDVCEHQSHTHTYMHTYIHTYAHTYIHIYIDTRTYRNTYTCVVSVNFLPHPHNTHKHTRIHTHTHTQHTHNTHTHTHIHTHTHTHISSFYSVCSPLSVTHSSLRLHITQRCMHCSVKSLITMQCCPHSFGCMRHRIPFIHHC